jgi:O-antigen/teichoic acid export membrane protein
MRRDIASAYLAIGARIGGMLVVSAVVFRKIGFESFSVFNLVRSTVGLLTYTGLGLAPAMVRMLAEARSPRRVPSDVRSNPPSSGRVMDYATPEPAGFALSPAARVYAAGEWLAVLLGAVGAVALLFGTAWSQAAFGMTRPYVYASAENLAMGLGLAIVLRLVSDPPSSVLLVSGRIALDNLFVATSEIAAAALAVVAVGAGGELGSIGAAYLVANLGLAVARFIAAAVVERGLVGKGFSVNLRTVRELLPTQMALLGFGLLVTLGQLADFLYSPVDYILITRLLRLEHVGIYAPAVQIDSGLLTLVTGLSAVLLPKAAVAHTAGEAAIVRRYYFRGTLASAGLLLVAAVAVWLLSPWIFRLWLGRDMPETRAILPLVLVHTVIGGSSAVGRSILLGMGKVKPFTLSVLVAGVTNVVLSYVFVRFFGWGLTGIVLGTIIAVVARAGLWMPWYVLRTLREDPVSPGTVEPPPPGALPPGM